MAGFPKIDGVQRSDVAGSNITNMRSPDSRSTARFVIRHSSLRSYGLHGMEIVRTKIYSR